MGKINVLSFAVANLIAAGEVVDRPASVIKELIENSIDSGADRITVEIQNGGVVFMRVSDNGCGIDKDDLPIAVRRHATSKIKDASDLDGILTLGFRGEALAAIAAVSDMRIISRPKNASIGAMVEVSSGDIIAVSERGCSEGTSVIVENLFGNVPARRKFLKRDVTETAAVSAMLEKIALSRPDISFKFIADGATKLETIGDGKLLSAIYSVFGREFSKKLIEVNTDYEGISVTGYIGRSDNIKPNRNGQSFFINGRYVKSRTVGAAIEQAYCSYIPPEKFPVCILFIEINPSAVDVNVHPAKLEVKFSNEKPVFEAVYYGVKNALERNTTRPDISTDKFSHISYEEYKRLFGYESNVDKQSGYNSTSSKLSNIDTVEAFVPQSSNKESQNDVSKDNEKIAFKNEVEQRSTSPDTSTKSDDDLKYEHSQLASKNEILSPSPQAEKTQFTYIERDPFKQNVKRDNAFQEKLSIEDDKLAYRIIGEAFNSYIIVEVGEKLLIVDKHAAHERIIFEKLKAGLANHTVASQILMLPLEFMLSSDEVLSIIEYGDEIEKIGFTFTAEKYTVKVTQVPETIELSTVPEIFMTIADRVRNATGGVELTRDIIFEKALYQASCKAALKAGREYGEEHIRWIIKQLMIIPDITFCPHGRPVAMEIKKTSLDRQFKRT